MSDRDEALSGRTSSGLDSTGGSQPPVPGHGPRYRARNMIGGVVLVLMFAALVGAAAMLIAPSRLLWPVLGWILVNFGLCAGALLWMRRRRG